METIELKDVMNQLPVADLVKNLAGVDKNGVPSQFTMENIAVVMGEKLLDAECLTTSNDLNNILDGWFYFVDGNNPGNAYPGHDNCLLFQKTLKNRGFKVQIIFCENSKSVIFRMKSGGGWGEWAIAFSFS